MRVKAGAVAFPNAIGYGNASHDFWYEPAPGHGATAGMRVTPETAMQLSSVYLAVRILAETIASLPIRFYRRALDGTKHRADDHPVANILRNRPNAWQTSFDFRSALQGWAALRGNGYSRVVRNGAGHIIGLIPLRPDRVEYVEQFDDWTLGFRYTDEMGRQTPITSDELLRVHGLSTDGVLGLSPITVARRSFGLSSATEEHGANLFLNGAKPGGILEHPARLSDSAMKNIRESWSAMHGGVSNSNRVAVLQEGMKWHSVSLTPEDSQFLETRSFQILEIARWFNIPPHKLMDFSRQTHSNIEASQIDFVTHTLRPWLVNWEMAIKRDLIGDEDDTYVELSVDGLLRGDSQARAILYKAGINDGWLTRNEVRQLESRNPIEGLDRPLVPLNVGVVDENGDIENPNAGAVSPPEPPQEPGRPLNGANERIRGFVEAGARRVVSKEAGAILTAWGRDQDGFDDWLSEFYSGHANWVSEVLLIPIEAASAWCDRQREIAFEAAANYEIEALCANWRATRSADLAAAIMELDL